MYFEDVIKLWKQGRPFPKSWNGMFRFFWPWYLQDENTAALLEHEEEYIKENLDDEEIELIKDFDLTLG